KKEVPIKLFLNFFSGFIFVFITILFSDSLEVEKTTALLGPIYVGIFEMGLTFFVWLKALTFTSNTARISNLIYITPFLSLFFIHLVVGEPIYVSTLAGLLLIISGIILQHRFTKITF
ncbi:MAG: EamA family transporter, partial [Candidatus Hydrothermae bacterium]|nr:EamA family transporter [Candidatus Hydrothermae bacterium]